MWRFTTFSCSVYLRFQTFKTLIQKFAKKLSYHKLNSKCVPEEAEERAKPWKDAISDTFLLRMESKCRSSADVPSTSAASERQRAWIMSAVEEALGIKRERACKRWKKGVCESERSDSEFRAAEDEKRKLRWGEGGKGESGERGETAPMGWMYLRGKWARWSLNTVSQLAKSHAPPVPAIGHGLNQLVHIHRNWHLTRDQNGKVLDWV